MPFQIKRIYEPAQAADGQRILTDRLWPRGVTKERAALSRWLTDISPSTELRKWFGHQPGRFAEFSQRYQQELQTDQDKQAAVQYLLRLSQNDMVTLLYAAKSPTVNHAIILLEFLEKSAGQQTANRH